MHLKEPRGNGYSGISLFNEAYFVSTLESTTDGPKVVSNLQTHTGQPEETFLTIAL